MNGSRRVFPGTIAAEHDVVRGMRGDYFAREFRRKTHRCRHGGVKVDVVPARQLGEHVLPHPEPAKVGEAHAQVRERGGDFGGAGRRAMRGQALMAWARVNTWMRIRKRTVIMEKHLVRRIRRKALARMDMMLQSRKQIVMAPYP